MSTYIEGLTQAATASSVNKSGTSDSKTEDVLGKEDFLTLLVTQLQNQDPLNPDDPTEFTAQLAQFSSLEQLFNLNEGMDSLVSAYESADKMSTLSAIGREVAYPSSSFSFSGEPVVLGYQLDGQASEVTLALKKDGVTLAILKGEELTKGTHYITWDGIGGSGQKAPIGEYDIIIQAKATEEETISAIPLVRSEVTGVDLDGKNGGTLITQNGETAFHSILGIYDPASLTKESQPEENSEESVNQETATTDTEESTEAETDTGTDQQTA